MQYTSIIVFMLWAGLALTMCACSDIGGDFKYNRKYPDCPEANRLEPAVAPFGAIVTLYGANFYSSDAQYYQVHVNGVLAGVVSVLNDSMLQFVVPQGAGSGRVSVQLAYLVCTPVVETGPEFTYEYTATEMAHFAGSAQNVTACDTCLHTPQGLDFDDEGNLWVADRGHRVVRKIDKSGKVIRTVGNISVTPDCIDCVNSPMDAQCCFFDPCDLVASGPGKEIFVADGSGGMIEQVHLGQNSGKITYAGSCLGSGVISPGTCKGINAATFASPSSLVWDGRDTFYLVDAERIRMIVRSPNCKVETRTIPDGINQQAITVDMNKAGKNARPIALVIYNLKYQLIYADGEGLEFIPLKSNPFSQPVALAVDIKGNIFVVDAPADKIYVVYHNDQNQPREVRELTGPVDLALSRPWGITLSEESDRMTLYVSDSGSNTIKKIILQ